MTAADTILVRPWPGLILDGIPSTGAEIPRPLAEEWIADRLVVRVERPAPPETPQQPPARQSTKGPGPSRPAKEGRPSR